jgi:lactoylglutathione lyase
MSGLDLVKPAIDVGVMSNQLEESQAFWGQQMRLPYDHLLKVGGGVHQHRYDLNGSVLKLNHSRNPLAEAVTGYTRLRIASSSVSVPSPHQSPEGVSVVQVPVGFDGIEGIEILWRTADLERAQWFLEDALGAQRVGERFRLGTTWFALEEDRGQQRTGARAGIGWRYITVQIADVEKEHQRLLALGVEEGSPPIRLGDTAYISFVRDPDGNWIELSQRASLTGPLPDVSVS